LSNVKAMRIAPRLSKSRYIVGLQCSRRLWLGWHDPEPRSEPEPGTILAVGTDVGVAARLLVPAGILVEEGPDQHTEAVERTRDLIADAAVPAIFEAAFAFDRVLIRADILERLPSLPSGGWRLAEVKSTTRVKPEHLHDLAIQAYVIAGSGLVVEEMQLVHVDTSYIRDEGQIDWPAYFDREEVTAEVRELLPAVAARVAEMHTILGMPTAPVVRPSGHCFSPYPCEFWDRCTANKPSDWVIYLPRLRSSRFAELDGDGVESMRDIPPDFPLTPGQQRVVTAVVSGREFISDELPEALTALGPPASYLDFETFSPAIPCYVGTSPYQRIPFQWSMHHDDGAGEVRRFEFLADGEADPRREFAETLIEAISRRTGPIVVYSAFEATVLRALATLLPDLSGSLFAAIDRMVDLLPIIRRHVTHPEFLGSNSIKVVAPALVPGFSYDDLDGVADGNDASAVFYRLATDRSLSDEDRGRHRRALLAYCCRDTLALMYVHRRLSSGSEVEGNATALRRI
jgi:predicted RecB family nuclease